MLIGVNMPKVNIMNIANGKFAYKNIITTFANIKVPVSALSRHLHYKKYYNRLCFH